MLYNLLKSVPKTQPFIAVPASVYLALSSSLPKFCVSGFRGIVQNTVQKRGAHVSFVYVGDVAHITICLAKNLQILRGDKNDLLGICLGSNLQTLESDQTFSVPNVKEFIFPNCMGL
jgi:hypothetical protein